LEKITALTSLNLVDNNLTTIDVRQNPELASLQADDIMVKANIAGTKTTTGRDFDLSKLGFIKNDAESYYNRYILYDKYNSP
ncbi:MAG: hypothetical protein HUJ62_07450, partial [Streptococcus gallolyticus]|nr:hypothetical protein [Streptococcus gallolyticus]